MDHIAKTPAPPYYAVIFTSQRTEGDHGYGQMAEAMDALAQTQPGFLGIESVRGDDGVGVTISYWSSLEAIQAWRAHPAHGVAQDKGKSQWYGNYSVRICKVERDYTFSG